MREIRASDLHTKWMISDPAYAREYEALEEEFNLASAIIAAHSQAGLAQEWLAQRVKRLRQ